MSPSSDLTFSPMMRALGHEQMVFDSTLEPILTLALAEGVVYFTPSFPRPR